ncbi:hypothetical protein [Clostridium sp. B9]|uniref:hypothetical protein n=1 Tax=Clostridium sp. B9 TaxID=3423224 RepID=UPI003D2EF295
MNYLKYIGSFFRINSLSKEEIEYQLLFLAKESVNHLVLESRCGISTNYKTLKENFKKDEISFFKNNTPLICMYKKAKPNIYSSKYSKTWDDTTFRKDIPISSNALMTLSLLRLCSYYESFKGSDKALYKRAAFYKNLSKLQLEFYYNYLRNNEGFFINKKNEDSSNKSDFKLTEKEEPVSYSDQAYMMLAYYMYSYMVPDDEDSKVFRDFSLQILNMFTNFKEELYSLSIEECCNINYCLNRMLSYSNNKECRDLVLDLSDFILCKYYESSKTFSDLESTTLLSMNMYLSYKNTNIIIFKDAYLDLIELFTNMFSDSKGVIIKGAEKKEYKYSNVEISFYLLNLLLSFDIDNEDIDKREALINKVYKNYIINSGIVTSFPEAPNLDSYERYRNFSLKSDDLIDESIFRMPTSSSPELTGLAPIFIKNIKYSKKKSSFTSSKTTFDSTKNMLIFFTIIDNFIDRYVDYIANEPDENLVPLPIDQLETIENLSDPTSLIPKPDSATPIVPPDANKIENKILDSPLIPEVTAPVINTLQTREVIDSEEINTIEVNSNDENLDDKIKNILDSTEL